MNPFLIFYLFGLLQIFGTAISISKIGNGDDDVQTQIIASVITLFVTILFIIALTFLPL